jgi:PadR family transcriptional regulator AphA
VPRQRKTGLTISEYAVLGLLTGGPDYGYRLQQHFSGESGLALVCPVEPAALYAVLKSLSGLELIDGEWDRTQYPPRAVHSLTPEGEATFERWLARPVARIRDVRSEFLVKLYFAMQRDPALACELLEAQLAVCREYEHTASHQLEQLSPGSFEAIVAASKLSAVQATIDWLDASVTRLETRGQTQSH